MNDTEKPKMFLQECFEKAFNSWRDRRKKIKRRWQIPFIFPEWICEEVLKFLKRWALLDILGLAGRFTVLVAVIFYIVGCHERQRQAENQRKTKQYQAWQVISAAQGKPGDLGRKIALQDLNRDGISLAGVDISNATLKILNLENADLSEAILSEAILIDANFSGANLFRADLYDADLHKVNLSDAYLVLATLDKAYLTFADLHNANLKYADLSDADLRYADLSGAILTQIKNWERIIEINNAYIHGVKDPPKGFVEWATEHGAFSNANREEWEKLKRQKRQEQEKKEQQK